MKPRHRLPSRHLALLALCGVALLPGCDGAEEADVLQVNGAWTSDSFMQEDQVGTVIGPATLDVEFRQTGSQLSGSGVLHLPQARINLPFELNGTANKRTVQFSALYETAPPEQVNCTSDAENSLKCLKGTVRFNLDREQP